MMLRVRQPDLVAAVRSTFDGKAWAAGQAGAATVTITNQGPVPAAGAATVVLYASPDGTLANAVEVARLTNTGLKLKPGKAKAFKFGLRLPAGLAGSSWRWLAVVNPDGSLPESDLTNNSGSAAGVFQVRAAA